MQQDWVAYLSGHGHTGRRATGSEFTYACFFDCNEIPNSKKKKLYVNSDSGLYSCKVCVCQGNGVTLMRHFGDEPEREEMPTTGRRREVLEDATAAGERMLASNEDVIDYLLGPRRHLSPESIVSRRLGYAPKQWPLTEQLPEDKHYKRIDLISAGILAQSKDRATGEPIEGSYYEYYRDRVLIPYIQDGRVVQLRGKDIFGRYYTAEGDPVYLYNSDSLKGATEAIIVEGEFDTIMLAELLATSEQERVRKIAVVGIAGTGALPEDLLLRLAHLKRVFIATDPDEPGRKAADKLKEKIGERAFIPMWPIAMTTKWIGEGKALKDLDWTTWIGQLGASVDEVAEMFKVPGRLKSTIQAMFGHRNRPTSGMKTGFTQLDAAFLPGLLPGQLAIFLAKTGVGKTVLLCNLAYNMRHQRVLFITLEMTAEEIWVRLARIYRFYEPFASDETIAKAYANLLICDANRLSEEDFEVLVDEYTEVIGAKPDVAFVDYLGYYARGRKGGSQYEKVTDAAMQLKAEGKKHELVVISPAQVNRTALDGKPIDSDSARDSGAIEETADLLVGVWRSDDALNTDGGHNATPTGKLHFKILKSRHGNRDRVFIMQMGLMSLVVVDETSALSQRAAKESHATFQGLTYERFLEQIYSRDRHLYEKD